MVEDKARLSACGHAQAGDRRESLDSGRERLPAACLRRCASRGRQALRLACLPFQRDRQAQAGNAVFRAQGPDVARMDFFNGLVGILRFNSHS